MLELELREGRAKLELKLERTPSTVDDDECNGDFATVVGERPIIARERNRIEAFTEKWRIVEAHGHRRPAQELMRNELLCFKVLGHEFHHRAVIILDFHWVASCELMLTLLYR
jgi:hypothetical protein